MPLEEEFLGMAFRFFLSEELKRFDSLLGEYRDKLASIAVRATGSPIRYHLNDIEHVHSFIRDIRMQIELADKYQFSKKGKVLIGLSSNEPIIVSSVPVISALVSGNQVLVRPSSKTVDVTRMIFQLLYKSGVQQNQISIVSTNRRKIKTFIRESDYVFWLGSYETCKKMAKYAIDSDKKFYFEAEGNDVCVIDAGSASGKVAKYIIKSVVTHNGQRCQAVRGILVHYTEYRKLRRLLVEQRSELKRGNLYDVHTDLPIGMEVEIVNRTMRNSESMTSFGPRVWIGKYSNDGEVSSILSSNQFGLSLYIFSRSKRLLDHLRKTAKFARIIVNDYSDIVHTNTPWGGLKRSGMIGPEPWLNKFSDRTYISQGGLNLR